MKSGLPLTWRYLPLDGLLAGLSPWVRVVLLVAVAVGYLWVMTRLVGRSMRAPHPVAPARHPPQAVGIEDEGRAA